MISSKVQPSTTGSSRRASITRGKMTYGGRLHIQLAPSDQRDVSRRPRGSGVDRFTLPPLRAIHRFLTARGGSERVISRAACLLGETRPGHLRNCARKSAKPSCGSLSLHICADLLFLLLLFASCSTQFGHSSKLSTCDHNRENDRCERGWKGAVEPVSHPTRRHSSQLVQFGV